MIDEIIAEMGHSYRKGVFTQSTCFVFFVGDATITVTIGAESYAVEKGAGGAKADCTCKTSAEMFRKIWFDGYRPGIMDFLSKEIRCDAPLLLPQFLKAFGR
jgi:hypothetical protein